MVTGEMSLPASRELKKLFEWLALERCFNFVDAGNGRPDAIHFALRLAANDFREKPLDHDRRERLRLRERAARFVRNAADGCSEKDLKVFMKLNE